MASAQKRSILERQIRDSLSHLAAPASQRKRRSSIAARFKRTLECQLLDEVAQARPSKKRKLEPSTSRRSTSNPSVPLKICDVHRSRRIGVVVGSLVELRQKMRELGLVGAKEEFDVVLDEDCTRLEDEDYFGTLERNTVLMAVSKGHTSKKGSTSMTEVDAPSTSGGSLSGNLAQVADRIARNPAYVTLLPKEDLEVISDANLDELQVLLHQTKEDTRFIQDACERRLNEQIKSEEAIDLLQLYKKARTETDKGPGSPKVQTPLKKKRAKKKL